MENLKAMLRVSNNTRIYAYNSYCLNKLKHFSVTFPKKYFENDVKFPVLFFLHGDGRDHTSIISNAKLRSMFEELGFVTIFPEGDKGWYINSEVNPESRYQDFLTELIELSNENFNISLKLNERAIGGWSMGAFGCVNYIMAYPDSFGTIASVIGLVDYPNRKYPPEDNYEISEVFPKEDMKWANYQACSNVEAFRGKRILIYSGDKAFDTKMNRNFHARLKEEGIKHLYIEEPGEHVWSTVENAIPKVIDFCNKVFEKLSVS